MSTGDPRTSTVISALLVAVALMGCEASIEVNSKRQEKIPITTLSDEARELYLEGREMVVPVFMDTHHAGFAYAVLSLGTLFTIYYVYSYLRMQRDGYQVSWLKTWLYASTGLTSIYTWGFNSFGEAFFIMNLFHAVQYFGLVWFSENRNMSRIFRVEGLPFALPITFLLFAGTAFGYGYFVEWIDGDVAPLFALTLTVSLMHFWYDGFIWSVRKKQV